MIQLLFKRSLTPMDMWQLSVNQTARIRGFSPQISADKQTRLEDLGFKKEEAVICLRKMPMGGPVVFQVQSTAYALEKDLAICVLVEINNE